MEESEEALRGRKRITSRNGKKTLRRWKKYYRNQDRLRE